MFVIQMTLPRLSGKEGRQSKLNKKGKEKRYGGRKTAKKGMEINDDEILLELSR